MTTQTRPLHDIADEIYEDWHGTMYYGAVPYVEAMRECNEITDEYGFDTAKSVVLYFLANAQTWRGPTARRVKAELKAML